MTAPMLAEASVEARFGAGLSEPYEHALRSGSGVLRLVPVDAPAGTPDVQMAFDHWMAPATTAEHQLLSSLAGPLLDVGCGPGRILAAAASHGIRCAGVETSVAATAMARNGGAVVLQQSIFDPLPHEGQWHSAVLLDGNIGIGGNPGRLLRRLHRALAVAGTLVVEVDTDPDVDVSYQGMLTDDDGRVSQRFPWALVGATALERLADRQQWASWQFQLSGRSFVRLERR